MVGVKLACVDDEVFETLAPSFSSGGARSCSHQELGREAILTGSLFFLAVCPYMSPGYVGSIWESQEVAQRSGTLILGSPRTLSTGEHALDPQSQES